MVAGAPGSIDGQSIEQFDHRDRCQPRRPVRVSRVLAPVLLLGAVALTACAWDPPTIERTPREAVGTEPSAKSRLAARKGTPSNGTAASSGPGEKIDVPGDMAALEVDLTNFKERLIGLDSDEINDLMGTPSLERAEPPALIWQYRHQVCTVDIFMFDDGGGSTVDHVEVRPTNGTSVTDKDCFTALLRNVPQAGAASAKAGPPIAPSPSTAVNRRAAPSAAPPPGPAQTPSSSRPPVPSTAAPSAAPAAPPRATAPAVPEGEEGPPPTDTDIDFDFGASNTAAPASPNAAAPAAPRRAPAAAPSVATPPGEAIPTLPPDEFSDEKPGASSAAKPAPGPSSSAGAPIDDDEEFADPLDSAPPKAPPPAAAATAKPSIEKPAAPTVTAKPAPAPAPLVAAPPAPAPPVVAPAPAPAVVTPSAPAAPVPSAAVVPTPPPAASAAAPAPLSPRGATATAQAQPQSQPKGAAKGAAKGVAAQVEESEDEDLPPGLPGLRADDPSRNNQDMVE